MHNCTIIAPVLFAGRSNQSGWTILSKNVAPLWEVQVQKPQERSINLKQFAQFAEGCEIHTASAGPAQNQNIH